MQRAPRLWLSTATPKAGELVRVRAQMDHPMETGLRVENGKAVPRLIVKTCTVTLAGKKLLTWEPDIAIAPHPYLEFVFKATQSGTLHLEWVDEKGAVTQASREVSVQ